MVAGLFLILIPLLLLSAFFSGSETILFSLSQTQRARIRQRSARDDARIEQCLGDSALLLSTLLVGNTFVNFAIATIGYRLFAALFAGWGGFLSVPVMTAALLLFGEITPKRLALIYAEELAPLCARALLFWRFILTPFNILFRFSSRAFSGVITRERRALSDAELVSVLEAATENGDFAADDSRMIEGVLRLSELHANDEMTPRVDIEGYDLDRPDEWRANCLKQAHHQYLPVYNRHPDAIEGVIETRTGRIESVPFVPEQITLDDLLITFRRSGKPMAIVTDEYGGTAGIITPNDILELILGPCVFGRDSNEPLIRSEGGNVWLIDGDASLDEINRTIGLELEAEDADRLAGWIASEAERIPHVGQVVESQGCRIRILKKRKLRVVLARLEVLEFPKTDSDEDLIEETDEAVEKTEEDRKDMDE